jgi:hypothetical protein
MKLIGKIWALVLVGIFCIGCSAQTTIKNDVFGMASMRGMVIGVVADNKVQFYTAGTEAWEHEPNGDLVLGK